MKIYATILVLSALGLAACNDGPVEDIGRGIDDAVDGLGNAVEDVCEDITDRPC